MRRLWHIYQDGRWGPERHIGFVIARGLDCIRVRTGVGIDAVKSTEIDPAFFTNPLSLDGPDYRKWRRRQRRKQATA